MVQSYLNVFFPARAMFTIVLPFNCFPSFFVVSLLSSFMAPNWQCYPQSVSDVNRYLDLTYRLWRRDNSTQHSMMISMIYWRLTESLKQFGTCTDEYLLTTIIQGHTCLSTFPLYSSLWSREWVVSAAATRWHSQRQWTSPVLQSLAAPLSLLQIENKQWEKKGVKIFCDGGTK